MLKKTTLQISMVFLLCCAIFSPEMVNADDAKNNDVHLIVKGSLVNTDDVFRQDGRIFLPLRLVGEKMDYTVDYNDSIKEIEIKKDNNKISMKIGDKKAIVNGTTQTMDVVPVLKKSKIYVPTRFVAESFGEKVSWDANNKMVIISQYSDPSLKIVQPQEFKTKNFRFSLQLSEKFKENIGYEIEDDAVVFYDIYNKEKSKDGSPGVLCRLIKSTHSASLTVPTIVLDYEEGAYIEAVMASDVQYSLEKKEFQEKYNESSILLVEALKTFKIN